MKKLCLAKHLKALINGLNRPARQCISEKLLSRKLFLLQYTNIDKIKVFCVLHDKVVPLTRRYPEHGTRNCHHGIFRKVLTRYCTYRKRLSKDEFFMTLMKLRLDFLLLNISFSTFQNIFGGIWNQVFYSQAWVGSDVKSFSSQKN